MDTRSGTDPGEAPRPAARETKAASRPERPAPATILVLAVWIGLYPAPFLRRLETSVNRVVVRVSPQYAQACGGAPSAALLAQNPAAKFLASVPCDAEGKPLVGSKGSGVDIGEEPKPSIGKPR